MRIFYDIETVPSTAWREQVAQMDIESNVPTLPPKEITKLKTEALRLERLAEWESALPAKHAADIAAQRVEKLEKAGLHWITGMVCSISMVVKNQPFVWSGKSEVDVLNAFAFELENWEGDLVGKNADNFDRPFLIGRFMVNDLGIPRGLRFNHPIEDVQHIWGKYNRNKAGSLDDMAWALGLDSKAGSWTQVQEWYDTENWDEMGKYNLRDSELCSEIFARYDKVWTV